VIEADQPVGLVDDHADRVEAKRAHGATLAGLILQPRHREASQPTALAGTQPLQRALPGGRALPVRAARLDLDEDECLAVAGDQVDLAVAGADVAREDREAEPLQMGRRQALAVTAECATRVLTRSLDWGARRRGARPLGWSRAIGAHAGEHAPSLGWNARRGLGVRRSRRAGDDYCCGTVARQRHTPRALTIAGSDSGGGAGIQADLKAFARCGVHGTSAITAITAQNTVGVLAIHTVPGEIVLAQVRAVLDDIGVDAVKVGMLGSAEVALAVARALRKLPPGTPIVVDPVMVAESGARLLDDEAQKALVEEILPLASVVTPNVAEARVLAGSPGASGLTAGGGGLTAEEAERLARAVLALGPAAVVLTGGHRAEPIDVYVDAREGAAFEIAGVRHARGAAHGSGCTHSSVLAAQLALGRTPLQAARVARALAGEAVAQGLRDIGAGAGPVDILGLERLRGGIIEER
jgi:hydroxymethylpyrimidine/phosphomethylpyrimidine kinase